MIRVRPQGQHRSDCTLGFLDDIILEGDLPRGVLVVGLHPYSVSVLSP